MLPLQDYPEGAILLSSHFIIPRCSVTVLAYRVIPRCFFFFALLGLAALPEDAGLNIRLAVLVQQVCVDAHAARAVPPERNIGAILVHLGPANVHAGR